MAAPSNGVFSPSSVWRLLAHSGALYARWSGPFTRPVLGPVALKLGGFLHFSLMPFLALQALQGPIAHGQLLPATLLVLLSPLPGAILFCAGLWRYLVLMASLSANAMEVIVDPAQRPDFRAAMRAIPAKPFGALVATLLGLLWLPALALFAATLLAGALIADMGLRLAVGIPLATLSLGALGAAIVTAIVCLPAFQVAALEPGRGSQTRAVMARCFELSGGGRSWRVLTVFSVWSLISGVLAPALATAALDITGLTRLLSPPAAFFVDQILTGYSPERLPGGIGDNMAFGAIYETLSGSRPALALELTRSFAALAVTLLTLPWGTFLFTLLYGDLRARREGEGG